MHEYILIGVTSWRRGKPNQLVSNANKIDRFSVLVMRHLRVFGKAYIRLADTQRRSNHKDLFQVINPNFFCSGGREILNLEDSNMLMN